MVKLVALRIEARLDVAQAITIGELRKGHESVLVLATEELGVLIAVVALNAA